MMAMVLTARLTQKMIKNVIMHLKISLQYFPRAYNLLSSPIAHPGDSEL